MNNQGAAPVANNNNINNNNNVVYGEPNVMNDAKEVLEKYSLEFYNVDLKGDYGSVQGDGKGNIKYNVNDIDKKGQKCQIF